MKELTPEEQEEFKAMWKKVVEEDEASGMTQEEKYQWCADNDHLALAGDPLDPEKYPHVKAEK